MFSMRGIISPTLVRQLHRIGESDIWQCWLDLFEGNKVNKGNLGNVKPANMDGNIVVVFAVWVCEIGLAVLFTFLEYTYLHIIVLSEDVQNTF